MTDSVWGRPAPTKAGPSIIPTEAGSRGLKDRLIARTRHLNFRNVSDSGGPTMFALNRSLSPPRENKRGGARMNWDHQAHVSFPHSRAARLRLV